MNIRLEKRNTTQNVDEKSLLKYQMIHLDDFLKTKFKFLNHLSRKSSKTLQNTFL